jgi:mRNA interferase MazF
MGLKQYQIVLVNLDPTIGSEMKKTRPCVILSPNEMNNYLQTIVIAPMTSHSKSYPTRVPVKHNKTKGWVVLDQIRTIDRQRIVKTLDTLSEKDIDLVKSIIHETYVA